MALSQTQVKREKDEWQELLAAGINRPEKLITELGERLGLDDETAASLHKNFPVRINPYYLGLIDEVNDPIWRQAIPDAMELDHSDSLTTMDPLAEDMDSPVPYLTHRYPDRVLMVVQLQCAMYCRFCTRRREVGSRNAVTKNDWDRQIEYIASNPKVRDVIISGGDPFMLLDHQIDYILKNLRAIPHMEIIRLDSRMPVTLPHRVTENLCKIMQRHHPVYLNTHFNHPREITPESTRACELMADHGIPLGNQSVLLRGVNDDTEVMKELVQKLLTIRVKPYYLYQADLVTGTSHFRTSVEKGLEIIKAIQGHTSGMAVPHFVIDAPQGGGKIPVTPDFIQEITDDEIVLKNYEGNVYRYPINSEVPNAQETKLSQAQTNGKGNGDLVEDGSAPASEAN